MPTDIILQLSSKTTAPNRSRLLYWSMLTRPSILCVTQKSAFMPSYIVLGQQRACMPVYIGKSGDLVG